MRPVADRIYQEVLGTTLSMRHDDNDTVDVLDKEHAIDVTLAFPNGMIINGQEKFLSADYAKYQSLTVEYEQNQHTGEHGDWFKIASQFYFTGYCNPQQSDFQIWVMVDWLALVLATQKGLVRWQQNKNKNGYARASFRFVSFRDIPKHCLIASQF